MSPDKRLLSFTLNGQPVQTVAAPTEPLVAVLRETLGLTGTKVGCGEGDCGACTVLLDGQAVNSRLVLALQVEGRTVRTIEGLADGERLHPVQPAFVERGAIQCGFCTPGMILSAVALLERHPRPSEAQVREGLSGNLCRCTGYQKIVEAVLDAADRLQGEEER